MGEFGNGAGAQSRRIVEGSGADVIELPVAQHVRVRLLTRAIFAALEPLGFPALCRFICRGPFRCLQIDRCAVVIFAPESRDLLFLLRMRCGPRVLLVTEDIDMIADFARQYACARINGNPALMDLL